LAGKNPNPERVISRKVAKEPSSEGKRNIFTNNFYLFADLRGLGALARDIPTFSSPSFILPRDAGEDSGGGLNGAQRLNALNVLNGINP